MAAVSALAAPETETLAAVLAAAAYRVVLRHGIQGPFIDVELDLWRELRSVLEQAEEERSWAV